MAMSQPLSGFDIPFGGDDEAWTQANQYGVWTQRFPVATPVLHVIERIEGAVSEAPGAPQALRLIPAAMPHRIAHLFGFWRESDADTLFFRSEQGGDVRYALVVSVGAVTYKSERLFWTCPSCQSELARFDYESRRFGLPEFWRFALERVREFNGDNAARKCPTCGTVHPLAYGFHAKDDRDDERAARAAM
jgi:hypothetical protein